MVTGVVSAVFLGIALGAAGVVEIIGAFKHRRDRAAVMPALSGILSVVVGVLFVTRPLVGVAALGLLVAAHFFATGLFRGIVSLADRYERSACGPLLFVD